ncbi:MAG: hypothetical protein DRJ11_10605 [Candidatus Aminicenantes bacterium]|nr:MAG: hypothetical protein DRJ11_10605 [Candidatus Aminicenantes bacterium]
MIGEIVYRQFIFAPQKFNRLLRLAAPEREKRNEKRGKKENHISFRQLLVGQLLASTLLAGQLLAAQLLTGPVLSGPVLTGPLSVLQLLSGHFKSFLINPRKQEQFSSALANKPKFLKFETKEWNRG